MLFNSLNHFLFGSLFKYNKPYHLGQFIVFPFLIIPMFILFLINSVVMGMLVFLFEFNNDNFNTFYFKNHQFTSNMVKTEDLTNGFYRLLTTDTNVILPYGS